MPLTMTSTSHINYNRGEKLLVFAIVSWLCNEIERTWCFMDEKLSIKCLHLGMITVNNLTPDQANANA